MKGDDVFGGIWLLDYQAYEKIRQPGAHAAVIIGGMVLDIQATPTGGSLVRGSTTPGEVISKP